MTRRELVLVEHREAIRAAAALNRCRGIALAGSVARGEDTADSDYDFVADFDEDVTLFDMCALEAALADLLGADVDVVPVSSVRTRCRGILDDIIEL